MKNIIKNISFALVGAIIAWVAFNPTIAYQIQSNLAKGFAAITASDVKEENKLVWLDADGLLPSDIFPASALTADIWYKDHFCMFAENYNNDSSTPALTCPTWFIEVNWFDWNGWGIKNDYTMYINWSVVQTYSYVYWASFACCVAE